MNSDKKPIKGSDNAPLVLFKIIFAFFIFASSLLGALVFSSSIAPDSRYFTESSGVFALNFSVVPAIIISLCAIFSFKGASIDRRENVASRIAALFTAAAATVPFIYYICSSLLLPRNDATPASGDISMLLLAITSMTVFLFSLSAVFDLGNTITLISGYCQVAFCIITVTSFYLDYSVELNSPIKLLLQFAAVAIMISTVSDLRFIIGRPIAPFFVISKLFAAALPILYFIAFVAEIAPNMSKYSHDYAIFVPFFLCYGIASTIKLISFKLREPADESANESDTLNENELN